MPKKAKMKARWWDRRLSPLIFWLIAITAIAGLIFILLTLFFQIKKEVLLDHPVIALGREEALQFAEETVGSYTNTHTEITPDSGTTPLTPIEATISANTFLPPENQVLLSGRISSFGDNFSGLGYINKAETDMYWDENVTAFTFPPSFELLKSNDCSEPFCGFAMGIVDPQSVCLKAGCLSKTADNKLYYKDKELKLPPALAEQTLSSITLAAIDNFWLIGLVSGPSVSERGWVYRFDGLAFSPLITDTTQYQILPRYERGGGRIAFGGSADDFLVAYTGYDGYAFRFRNESVENISDYFGLRVTNGGFLAQILKIGSGQDANFYVCSVTEGKPKVLKIWSKDAEKSGGAIEFSSLPFAPQQIICGISDAAQKKLAIAAKQNGTYTLYSFQDKGFDNSRERRVTSVNLNQNKEAITAAVFADIGLETRDGFPGKGAVSYLANSANQFELAAPYLWHGFENDGSELYWRLDIAASLDAFYSPWLSHINRLDYMFKD